MTISRRDGDGNFDPQEPVVPPVPETRRQASLAEVKAMQRRLATVEEAPVVFRAAHIEEERMQTLEQSQRGLRGFARLRLPR